MITGVGVGALYLPMQWNRKASESNLLRLVDAGQK